MSIVDARRASCLQGVPSRGFRADIQGLRALAVTLVVVFHFWPTLLPGGYIGVDVFFVISGYLITDHLIREHDRTGRIAILQFWARRARRLLPAALLVLLVTSAAILIWVTRIDWSAWFEEVASSTLYVENWYLAWSAVDYLAADDAASPVQHYWSLSLEEQFYLLWPLLIIVVFWIARRVPLGTRLTALRWTLIGVGGLSLVFAIWFTAVAPAAAFFVTPTRVWEFAAGAIAGLTIKRLAGFDRARTVLAWVGVAMIVSAAVLYGPTTPFPGFAAIVPVLGASLVVLGGDSAGNKWAVGKLASIQPVQTLGRISYSVYLWHWPPLIIIPVVLWRPLSIAELLALLLAVLAVGWATERWVETPLRSSARWMALRPRRTFGAVAVGMILTLVLPAAGLATVRAETQLSAEKVTAAVETDPCLGALSSLNGCDDPATEQLLPLPAAWLENTGDGFDCYDQDQTSGPLVTCTFGSDEADAIRVAIVGDSHAAMLVPALQEIDGSERLSVDQYLGRPCLWVATEDDTFQPDCDEFREQVSGAVLAGKYDAVIITGTRSAAHALDRDAFWLSDVRLDAWTPVMEAGSTILAVTDNPRITPEVLDCTARSLSADVKTPDCGVARDDGFALQDAVELAAERASRIELLDTNDIFCDDNWCPTVIGGLVAYLDTHHITAAFSRTLATPLADALQRAASLSGDGELMGPLALKR